MTKPVEDLAKDDRIVWELGSGPTVLTVDAVLVFPPSWPTTSQVAIHTIGPDGQPRIVEASYGQEVTLADS